MGFTSFFNHVVTIAVLLFAWVVVILAFFILAVQLFITVIEFKLTTLAGFVLVPFALWNKTAFLAERVLGNVVSAGIKVMVLAVIVGIGTTFFSSFTGALQGQTPDLAQAMSLVLASLTLFGLGIFGPGIAAGLVSGAPQLGAGAAIGTVGAVAAGTFIAGAGAMGLARLGVSGGLAAIRAGTALGSGASTAYGLAQATSGAEGLAGIGAGLGGVARAGFGAFGQGSSAFGGGIAEDLAESAAAGRRAAWRATGGKGFGTTANGSSARIDAGRRTELGRASQSRAALPCLSPHREPGDPRRRPAGLGTEPGSRRVKEQAMIFKRAIQRYGQTPEPVTPYQKAAQLWDERIGSARVQAKNWRLMAFGSLRPGARPRRRPDLAQRRRAASRLMSSRSTSSARCKPSARRSGPTSPTMRRSRISWRASSPMCARSRSIRSSCARIGWKPTPMRPITARRFSTISREPTIPSKPSASAPSRSR